MTDMHKDPVDGSFPKGESEPIQPAESRQTTAPFAAEPTPPVDAAYREVAYVPVNPTPTGENTREDKHPRARIWPAFLMGLLGVVVGGLITAGVLGAMGGGDVDPAVGDRPIAEQPADPASGEEGDERPGSDGGAATSDDAGLAERVAADVIPSVVSIDVFLGEGRTSAGVGSGVILDREGHILTNYHVIEGGDRISVKANDKSYEATVVGSDPSSDLAVIKVEAPNLRPIEIGDSSKLEVGEWVMAIGSPFGYEKSVSTGIVSALYRSTSLPTSDGGANIYANLIQTDAAINPGNSGGALVNADGELVGINSLIESGSRSSSGVGFAIPTEYAMNIAEQIMDGKEVTHAYLGVSLQSVNPFSPQGQSLEVTDGANVVEVTSGSPADEGGIEPGDIITSLDGDPILSADDLIIQVRRHRVGEEVTVGIVRSGQELSVEVTLGSDAELRRDTDEPSGDQNTEETDPFDLYRYYNQRQNR